jgi:hypothetical protein
MARLRYYRVDNFRRRELQRVMRPLGATEIEIESVLRQYRGRRWNRTAVGRRINLTFARWELLGKQVKRGNVGLRHIWPSDRTAEQMRQYLKDRRREADCERKRRDRMGANMNPKIRRISPRARVLAVVLANAGDGDWMPSRELIGRMKRHWRGNAGKQLKDNAMHQALHQAARELCAAGVAEQKIETRRSHAVRFLRWSPTSTFQREDFARFSMCGRESLMAYGLSDYEKLSAHRRCVDKPGISEPGLSEKKACPLESLSSYERTRSPSKRHSPMLAEAGSR